MTEIRDRSIDLRSELRDLARGRRLADDELRDLLEAIVKDKARKADLVKVEVEKLSAPMRQALGEYLARELRGQLPGTLAQAVARAQVGPEVLQALVLRLANAFANAAQSRAQAATAEAARAQAADPTVPRQALRWTQLVQRPTHAPGGAIQGRAGSAAPRTELATMAGLAGGKGAIAGAAGLRSPKLVETSGGEQPPARLATLMQATLGGKLAQRLRELGITDPLSFVRAGALPRDRAALAGTLGIDRGRLLGLLMRAELLGIGPGCNGELGLRPDLLVPLRHAGIAMVGTLAAVRGLRRDELGRVYQLLREASGGFARAVRNTRPPLKRDLLHWARAAARRRSEILLADVEDASRRLSRDEAQELVYAWYLEGLFWDALRGKRGEDERQGRREREPQDEDRRARDDDEPFPELAYDPSRKDELVCFWITDFHTTPGLPDSMRRMYVCLDRDTGAIIPQQVEAEVLPSR